ncbi:UNVERIFIED_CONTAM: hypothetical protein FKN15_004385 [Acipenser sinensis]
MEVGMRVTRGVDWKWGNQDDGEGHVGTVVEIGRQGSTTTPDKTVVVQWDSGTRTNYRTGYQGSFDLLLYDNAQIGVRHSNIICDSCKKHGIMGMRWKCKVCFDYDLCTQCYMNNKHDLSHTFERYETAHSQPVILTPRQNLSRIILKGIFQGVKVVRGPDWDWGNQDDGFTRTCMDLSELHFPSSPCSLVNPSVTYVSRRMMGNVVLSDISTSAEVSR